ncbi:hypothetical protein GCM10009623_34500 [Nocardioides aestuarii]
MTPASPASFASKSTWVGGPNGVPASKRFCTFHVMNRNTVIVIHPKPRPDSRPSQSRPESSSASTGGQVPQPHFEEWALATHVCARAQGACRVGDGLREFGEMMKVRDAALVDAVKT